MNTVYTRHRARTIYVYVYLIKQLLDYERTLFIIIIVVISYLYSVAICAVPFFVDFDLYDLYIYIYTYIPLLNV